jgi:hypothetical protein
MNIRANEACKITKKSIRKMCTALECTFPFVLLMDRRWTFSVCCKKETIFPIYNLSTKLIMSILKMNILTLQEMVGPFHSEFYVINGMLLESRKRREHLSEEDLQKNKALMESFTKGSTQGFDNNGEVNVLHFLPLTVFS